MEALPAVFIEAEEQYARKIEVNRIDDTLYSLVSRLTKITGEITFASIPDLGASYYLGLTNYLDRNRGIIGDEMYQVIKFLENKYHFLDILTTLEITNRTSVFIGNENILPELESSTMIVKRFEIAEHVGYLGILGSTKMDYAFNITALRQVL